MGHIFFQNKTLQVVTSKGTIQGKEDVTDAGVAYFSFSGIPFARPPLGNLRFRVSRKYVFKILNKNGLIHTVNFCH